MAGQDIEPVIGQWYRSRDGELVFQVVALDEDEDTIEIQHFDGDLEALPARRWAELDIDLAAEPEDWSGPMDEVDSAEEDADEDTAGGGWRDTRRGGESGWTGNDWPDEDADEEDDGGDFGFGNESGDEDDDL